MKCLFFCSDWFKKTKSHKFLIKIIQKKYTTKIIYGLSRKEGIPDLDKISKEPGDIAIFFHILPKPNQIKKLKVKQIIWIPLYDGTKGWIINLLESPFYWGMPIKTINFSKKLHDIVKYFYPSLHVTYFPKPSQQKIKFNKIKVLLWQRVSNIDLDLVKSILDFDSISNLTIRLVLDNNKNKLIKKEKKVKIITNWLNKKEYNKLIAKHNVFIAPREKEGIGFSFLEPLSKGLIIIANNDTTMNEYIVDKKNGFLFNYKNPKKIKLENLEKIQDNAQKINKNGYKAWIKQKQQILNWISEDK